MTEDTKKSVVWTGGAMAALIAVIAVLWAVGVFDTMAVQ